MFIHVDGPIEEKKDYKKKAVEFARAVVEDFSVIDKDNGYFYCVFCLDSGLFPSDIEHNKDCIVLKAIEFLEEVVK